MTLFRARSQQIGLFYFLVAWKSDLSLCLDVLYGEHPFAVDSILLCAILEMVVIQGSCQEPFMIK